MLNTSPRSLRRSIAPACLLISALSAPVHAQYVVAWGVDDNGVVSDIPQESGITKISTSYSFDLALRADGSIAAWGKDTHGQVSTAPAGTGFLDVSAAAVHGVAIRANGSLVSWGFDSGGQVSQTPPGIRYVEVSTGPEYSMALRQDGTIAAWGADSWSVVSVAPTGANYTAIACGDNHALALRADGSIHSWGRNYEGQVSDTPPGSGFTQIAAGYLSSMALRADGSIAVWGGDYYDLISHAPTGTGFVQIAVASRHMSAIASDGSITSWGWDTHGEVSTTPGGTGYTRLALGSEHSLALRSGSNPTPPIHNISGATVGTYSDLQTAIDAAGEGDVLLVGAGNYAPFTISGKSLSIFALDEGARIPVSETPVRIENLGPQQRVVLSGMDVSDLSGGIGWGASALVIQQNQGHVYIQDSRFESDAFSSFDFDCQSPVGVPGTSILNSARVAFSACEFTGRGGSESDDWCSNLGAWSTPGTSAVRCENSSVTFSQCSMSGGAGGGSSATGTATGGAGLDLRDSTVFLLGSIATGGPVGTDDAGFPWGSGGPGVALDLPSELHHLDSVLQGGWGSSPGPATSGPGINNAIPGSARSLLCDPLMEWSAPSDGTFLGEAGDSVYFLSSLAPKFRWLIPLGVQQLTVTLPLQPAVGVVPGTGSLVAPFNFSGMPISSAPGPVAVQGFSLSTSGTRHLSGVRHILPIDSASLPDCNQNGINDYLDILIGTSLDADDNLLPDECGV